MKGTLVQPSYTHKGIVDRALDTAAAQGATYADVRIQDQVSQSVQTRNGAVENLLSAKDHGFGVRVIVDGAWGFASSSLLETAEADRIAALAVEIARASAMVRAGTARLSPEIPFVDRYETPVAIDPFTVPIEQKLELLMAADAAMQAVRGIKVALGSLYFQRDDKTFASTEGGYIEQRLFESGCGINAIAVGGREVQNRSYPNSGGRHQVTEGFEFVRRQDLPGNASRVAEEAVALLTAPQCPSGEMTVVLDGSQVALQVHESCGHPVELDRVMGTEAAYAGTSFLTLDKLGSYQYGSEHVSIISDGSLPGGLGTFGYDDEGVPAQRVPIIEHGVLVNYLTDRQSAAQLDQRSNGTGRASSWGRIPLVRMTNLSIEPGTWSFDDLLADTDDGLYMQTNRSWSIDDRRLNFQFGTEIAWEIKGGKLGKMYRNPTYTGITPRFWNGCDAVCNEESYVVWGTPNCGKGQPSQVAHVGHGAAPARFRNVRVGVVR